MNISNLADFELGSLEEDDDASDADYARTTEQRVPLRRPMTRTQLQYADDLEVLREYHAFAGTQTGEASLGILYARHNRLMRTLALELFQRRPHVGSVDDCMSIIHIAAQVAYSRYNEEKAGPKAKLTTFLFKTVRYEMLTQADRESFVHCPSQLRDLRAYFLGGYDSDPIKKDHFEQAHNLTNPESRANRRAELVALMPNFFMLDEPILDDHGEEVNRIQECFSDPSSYTQEGLSLKADLSLIKRRMNARQRAVYSLVWEESLTMPETAEQLGISLGKVITADRGIKRLFVAYRESVKHEALA